VPLTPYEEELHNIFFSLKASDEVVSNLEETEEEADDSDVDNDGSIEEDDGGNKITKEPIESEEERRDALNKLSKVKKNEILQMAILDLDVVRREMLGPDLKENQRKQRDDRQKQIDQIHEAVAHFQSEAETRRVGLQNTALDEDDTHSNCSWEEEYINILPGY
jgi:thymidylate synthase